MKIKVQFKRGAKGKKKLAVGEAPAPVVRVPRIAKLMALAIHFDQLIRDGKVKDQAEIAELGHVTRPRLTQIMNLLTLAPDIQERVLMQQADQTDATITERQLRPLTAACCWDRQRKLWKSISSVPRA